MDDPHAAEVLRLLHNILGEVRTVKKTVEAHEARFDDVDLQLKLLQSRDEAPLKSLPRYVLVRAPRESVQRAQRVDLHIETIECVVQFQLRPGDGWLFVGRGGGSRARCWTDH